MEIRKPAGVEGVREGCLSSPDGPRFTFQEEKAMFSKSRWPGRACPLGECRHLIKRASGVEYWPILIRPSKRFGNDAAQQ